MKSAALILVGGVTLAVVGGWIGALLLHAAGM